MAIMRQKKTVSAPRKQAAAPEVRGRAHALDVPFSMRALATASGARWEADHGVFVYRGESLPAGLTGA